MAERMKATGCDVGLEIWALFVVTAIAGSFAAFFASGDRPGGRS